MKYGEIAILLNVSIFKAKELELNLLKRNMPCTQDDKITKTLSTNMSEIRELRKNYLQLVQKTTLILEQKKIWLN